MPRRPPSAARRMYFTDEAVAALKPPRDGSQVVWWDAWVKAPRGSNLPDVARGLCVLVSPLGTKSFRVAYYMPHDPKTRFLNLGRLDQHITSVAQARQLAREARQKAAQGEDPRVASYPLDTTKFGILLERYIYGEQMNSRKNLSASRTKKFILHHCKPLVERPVGDIRQSELRALLESVRDGGKGKPGAPYAANRLHSNLKDFFAWVKGNPDNKVAVSPMLGLDKPFKAVERRKREWFKEVAGDAAIVKLWKAASEFGGDEERYLKAMLILAKRKSALAGMQWEQIDDTWFWHPPESRARNKLLFGCPLPKLLQRVLGQRKESAVFGRLNLDKLQAKVREHTGLDFFYHGLRHLAETKCEELQIDTEIRDLLFDHTPERGTGAVYNHVSVNARLKLKKADMLAALETWAAHIEGLVGPGQGVQVLR